MADESNKKESGASPLDAAERVLLDLYAGQAMQALMTAAWAHPAAANKAYEDAKKSLPPGETLDFRGWLANYAFGQAVAMLEERRSGVAA